MSRNVNFVARLNRDDRHKLNYQLIEHTAVFHFTGFAEFSYRSHRTSSGPRALRSTEIRNKNRHQSQIPIQDPIVRYAKAER